MIPEISLAKMAPLLFLQVSRNESGRVEFNLVQVMQTLIVAGIVAGVTMFGTVSVLRVELDYMRKDVTKIASMAEEAVRVQREIVPMRNLQVKTLQEDMVRINDRLTAIEAKRK